MKEKIRKHIIGISYLSSVAAGSIGSYHSGEFKELLISSVLYGMFFVHPFILTILNLYFLFEKTKSAQDIRKERHVEYLTLAEGSLYTLLYLPFTLITAYDWTEVLYNSEKHTPIWTGGVATIAAVSAVGILGYLFLSCVRMNRIPPLMTVSAMAGMYLGMLMCVLWIIQIFAIDLYQIYLCLFPFNCILLGTKLIRRKMLEWKENQPEERKEFQNRYLDYFNQKLLNSASWPFAAFLLMWPLLAVVVCILILFGQQPDSVIKAWTETSDWNLSAKVAPQNIYYDEHYLCTVAAGGHRRIVKPVRMGERHGHRVVVNRQLCIANAFEQIFEERTPRLHRHLRHFYDTCGFPVARLIHSPYTADVIYFVMKPLEWLFLIILYFCDVNPENRIAVQYLPKPK